MSGGTAGSDKPAGGRPEWPMAPGVPGSAKAREARAIVGVSPDASDSEFVGASPSDGRDALVSAARRRLEPVLAAHGLDSRESWLVDHELKSALGRLLASMPPPAPAPAAAQTPSVTPAPPPTPAPVAAQTPSVTPAPTPTPAPAPAAARRNRAAAPPDLTVAAALYLRRNPVGRAMLSLGMQRQHPAGAAGMPAQRAGNIAGEGPWDEGEGHAGDASAYTRAHAHAHVRTRSRARLIAATVAVLSAIGLVIEIAYVPVHLQRARAKQRSGDSRTPAELAAGGAAVPSAATPDPAAPRQAPVPTAQPGAPSDTGRPRGDTARADGAAGEASARAASSTQGGTTPAPRQVPIPSPALPAEGLADGAPRAAPADAPAVDPTVRQRLDRLSGQWMARVIASMEAQRTIGSIEPATARWLAQARLLERLIALDDIAQLLVEARADDAEPLIDVMPVPCSLTAPEPVAGEETSSREDGRLVTDLSRAGGGGESRLAVLRAYRSLPLAPGRADARALVSEALGGPSRNSRALALAILLERGATSVAVLEAVHARVGDLTATQAGRAVVEQLAGEMPGGAPLDAQSLRARLARRILEGRGAPMHLIDATADATAAMLDRMARRADPQVAPADIESSISTLARTASRDAAPARIDGARGPLQRMVAALSALEGARIVRNYRRLPDERARIDSAAAAASARASMADSSLGQAIEVATGLIAQDCIALRMQDLPLGPSADGTLAGAGPASPNPLLLPLPGMESIGRWPDAARALGAGGGDVLGADALIRIAEDVQDSSADDSARAVAAQLYARAATVGNEAAAASAARGIASLIPPGGAPEAAERHRWESIAAQYAMADAAMRGIGQSRRRTGTGIDAESDPSSRVALADAIALCLSGYGRQAQDRLQSPTVRALAQRLSGALPGGLAGLEALCDGRTPSSPPLEMPIADQMLALEAALREPRSTRWSDDLALRRGLPLVSIDAASRAARASAFTPAPAPGPQ